MSEADETEISQYSDLEGSQDLNENVNPASGDSKIDNAEEEQTPVPEEVNEKPAECTKIMFDVNHPLMIKYQQDLKERLLNLLQETDEQLLDLKRAISSQEKENNHFAKKGHEFQKELCLQEEKLSKIHQTYDEQVKEKLVIEEKCKVIKENFEKVEGKLQAERKNDMDYQRKLEDIAFQVVQLTSLQGETFTDAKSLQRAVEKSSKDRENLELQKLRQESIFYKHFTRFRSNLKFRQHMKKT